MLTVALAKRGCSRKVSAVDRCRRSGYTNYNNHATGRAGGRGRESRGVLQEAETQLGEMNAAVLSA